MQREVKDQITKVTFYVSPQQLARMKACAQADGCRTPEVWLSRYVETLIKAALAQAIMDGTLTSAEVDALG